ncbi:MAG TPA: hypothetical protein GX506_02575 [Firmicutes bacterium]|nr:hypothetical protein [Bacillota bacterium]
MKLSPENLTNKMVYRLCALGRGCEKGILVMDKGRDKGRDKSEIKVESTIKIRSGTTGRSHDKRVRGGVPEAVQESGWY